MLEEFAGLLGAWSVSEQELRVVVAGVGEPGSRVHLLVHCECVFEWPEA